MGAFPGYDPSILTTDPARPGICGRFQHCLNPDPEHYYEISGRMRLDQIVYRIRQFWLAVDGVPDPDDLLLARSFLTAQQMELFQRMQLCEQAHSLQVYKTLTQGYTDETGNGWDDLLVAALLHDVGKNRYPLSLWERVEIVIARALLPDKSRAWGAAPNGAPGGKEPGWRKPFIIAEQHAEWGAEMAAAAGASPLAVALIRRHQDAPDPGSMAVEERLLATLQAADNNN
jgi:hypothetical protein